MFNTVFVKPKVYISGALTGVPQPDVVKHNYEQLGTLCQSMGLDAYVPHLHTDPVLHPNITSRAVYEADKHQVCTSDLVIACVDYPSLGVGQELEIARENGVPVILLCKKDYPLSRMARGSPGVTKEIRYEDFDDALHQVSRFLEHRFSRRIPQPALTGWS